MHRARRPALALLLAALACTAKNDPATDDVAGSGDAASTGAESPLPAACSFDESPFLRADCLTSLRDACLAHTDQTTCVAQPTFAFDGYDVDCGWANVLTFADETSCTMTSEVGRCEATIVLWDGLAAPCNAIPSELEIIEIYGGPLGPWSAVDAEGGYIGSCAPNVQPPAPALCDCAPATCDPE
jgi:hypothetical protein